MPEYDEKKWSDILAHLESDGVYGRLSAFEKAFLGTCLDMNDKRIMLTEKQREHLDKIYARTI